MNDRIVQLEEEIDRLKKKVRSNPWPWLVGGLVIGTVFGAIFF